jgi:hypothetical protein
MLAFTPVNRCLNNKHRQIAYKHSKQEWIITFGIMITDRFIS